MAFAPAPSSNDDDIPALRRPPPPLTWRDRIEQAADATGTTPARIVIGVAAAAVAVVIGLWLTRPPADPVEVSLPYASTTVSLLPATTGSTGAATLVVHVAGAVVAPGVHELPAGARVDDAIGVAGGLAPGADGARLNLAAPVADGERVYVPTVGEDPLPVAGGGTGATGAGGTGPATGPVDLNQADAGALDSLPGIGPATASAILEHRDRIGRFTSVEQLLDVRGIGEAKLEGLRDLVTV
ncbi:MAG: helix-hairpin-helix domain-containing protein [Acidimicrobiales bacterium]